MFLRLLFLLTLIPFLEIYFLIRLSESIGWGNTFVVIFITGFIGAWFLRQQGHSILTEVQQRTSQNEIPSDALAKGFFTFVGGLLLLTPGVLTDVLGLSLIFPLTQVLWKKYFKGQWQKGMSSGNIKFYSSGPNPFSQNRGPFESQNQPPRRFDPNVIDIQARRSEKVPSSGDEDK